MEKLNTLTYRNDWIKDSVEHDIMILQLKLDSDIEPGPSVNIVRLENGNWEVEFQRRSDVECAGDETLYYGTNETDVQCWIHAAEAVADFYYRDKTVPEDERTHALLHIVEERCW